MKEILEYLPSYVETPILIILIFGGYKLYEFWKKKKKEQKDSQELFKQQILEEERLKADLQSRLTQVEEDVVRVREEIKEHKISYSSGFKELSEKIDKINEMLINFFSRSNE